MSSSDEVRDSTRKRSFLGGEIVYANGASRIDCIVREMSETGARIDAPISITIPEFFELNIPQRNIQKRVRIVWRQGSEIGVEFVTNKGENAPKPQPAAPAPAPVPPPSSAPVFVPPAQDVTELRMRVMEIEVESARMRAQITELKNMVEHLSRALR